MRDLLNLAKLEEGKFSVRRRSVDPRPMLDDALARFAVAARKRALTLRLQLPPTALPKVSGDVGRLGQVMSNLLSNAIKYTPAGGRVTIGAEVQTGRQLRALSAANPLVKIEHTDHPAGYLRLWVRDSGIGIAPEQQRHLFTKFYRAKTVLETETEGTGLGLYISKSIVTLHRGDIWFTSRPGQGSTFTFTVPIAPARR